MEFNQILNIFYIGSAAAILALTLILVAMIRLETKESSKEELAKEEADQLPDIDLAALTKELNARKPKDRIELTSYEEEQEAKAIISYEELVNTCQMEQISYTQELDLGGLTVKTIDMNNLVATMDPKPLKVIETEVVTKEKKKNLVSYEQEEAFLNTLKRIQSLLD